MSAVRQMLFSRIACVLLLIFGSAAPPLRLVAQTSLSSQSGTGGVQTIRGRTINAVTGAPIGRVLVRCGTDAMLTDYEGAFQFTPDGGNAVLSATKPGYWAQEDPAESDTVVLHPPYSDKPIELRLFPEAVLTGTMTSPSGEPLANILITPRRSVYDESGHRWDQMGITRTDSHGEFRIPLAAGDYTVQTNYSPPNGMRKEAILNVTVPDTSLTNASGYISLHSGETQHLDLHPPMLPVTPVTLRTDPEAARSDARIALSWPGGIIYPSQTMTANPGEVQLEIPSGTYLLTAQRHTPDGLEEAETRLTVGDHAVNGPVLRFSPVNPIPVEIQVEPSSTSDNTPPSIAQLGLVLQNTKPGVDPADGSQRFTRRGGTLPAVLTPAPGSYRLSAQAGGQWFIRSATYGTSDLLTHDLVVAAGVGSAPIQLVVSRQTASIGGTVRSGGQAAAAWIYLISSTPSATPLVMVHANPDGTYSRTSLPPGSYRAIAFEHKHAIDLQDAEVQAIFANDLHAVSLNSGSKATLDLDVAPFHEGR